MSEKDLVKELKSAITEITQDRDDTLEKMKSKDSRNKQVLSKREHATADGKSLGHKIGDQKKEIAEMKATEDHIKAGAPASYEIPLTFDQSNFFG